MSGQGFHKTPYGRLFPSQEKSHSENEYTARCDIIHLKIKKKVDCGNHDVILPCIHFLSDFSLFIILYTLIYINCMLSVPALFFPRRFEDFMKKKSEQITQNYMLFTDVLQSDGNVQISPLGTPSKLYVFTFPSFVILIFSSVPFYNQITYFSLPRINVKGAPHQTVICSPIHS